MDVATALKHIQHLIDRHGHHRYYYRRPGGPRCTLPGLPGSSEFMAAYNEAHEGPRRVEPTVRKGKGTLAALIKDYENSAKFNDLGKLTKREMGYVLRKLEAEHGDKPVANLGRKHIIHMQNALKNKPGAANKMLGILKQLLSYGIDEEYRADNPALGIKMLKKGEWRPWTDDEMRTFEAFWPLGSFERTGYALALYTGQRRADVAKMTWKQIAGGVIKGIKQGKTGAERDVPIHPELKKALTAIGTPCMTAIVAKNGKALNEIYFGSLMAEAIGAAGLPDDCVLHGLRKCATVALIDAGCSPHEAAAITGHETIRMLEHYAKKRDQKKLGKAAIIKWDRAVKKAKKARART